MGTRISVNAAKSLVAGCLSTMKGHAEVLHSLSTPRRKVWTRQLLSMRPTTVVGLSFVLQLLTNPRARVRARMAKIKVKARMAKARKARKARRRRSLLPRVQVPWLNQLGKNR